MNALFTYFKESWQELAKVSWPSRQKATQLTISVIMLSAIVGSFIAAVDFAMVEVLQRLILGAG